MIANREDVRIFALLGQSNMDGTGSLDEFDNHTDDRILRIVNRQIAELDRHIDHVRTVTSEGTTHIGDALHLDTRSQILMGERYAAKMIELLAR